MKKIIAILLLSLIGIHSFHGDLKKHVHTHEVENFSKKHHKRKKNHYKHGN